MVDHGAKYFYFRKVVFYHIGLCLTCPITGYSFNDLSVSADAPSRGMARALLAWTETRDLSFSLLRMLDIDISLPFKFVGLLVTYLIILLQFQKIIDLDA